LLLAGVATPHQWKVTLATLDTGNTRVGNAYSWEKVWSPTTYEALGLKQCVLAPGDINKLERGIQKLRDDFVTACEQIVSILPNEPGPARAYAVARRACGYLPPLPREPPLLDQLYRRINSALDALANSGSEGEAHASALRKKYTEPLNRLKAFRDVIPGLDGCYTDQQIADQYVRKQFAQEDWRAGVGVNLDFLPLLWGFQPDPATPLSKGSLMRLEVRGEASERHGQLEWYVALGLGGQRSKADDDLRFFLSPTIGASWLLGTIGREPLHDSKGELNLVNGTLPPHVTVGFSALVDITPSPVATQKNNVDQVELIAYADFVFTKELALRVSVPVTAKLVTRTKDQGGPESALQWSAPVSVFAVVKK
jgi:hypothetical protein